MNPRKNIPGHLSTVALFCALSVIAAPLSSAARPDRVRDATRVGDMAPDFTLASPDGKTTVQLSGFRGTKPVVLIFGSYTCPPFRDVYPKLERLHREDGNEVEFLYVYIREAHPDDGWKMPRNQREGIVVKDPKTMDERIEIAREACVFFKTSIPAVVDTMDNAVDRAYAGWPSRIFVVDVAGKIAVQGGPGPRGLVPAARAVEAWLKKNHGSPASAGSR
jgi:thiol-disulfide isomerase/thioredoxin